MNELFSNFSTTNGSATTCKTPTMAELLATMEKFKRRFPPVEKPTLYCHPNNREWVEREVAKIAGDVPVSFMCRIETSEWMNERDADGEPVAYKVNPAFLNPVRCWGTA